MSETAILTIVQVFGGGLFGFIIAKYTLSKQIMTKNIIYKKSVLSLLSLHKENSDHIRVSVKESILIGNSEDPDKEVEINNAYAHEIKIKNRGNIEATDLFFDIEFDKDIKIISYSIYPEPNESYPLCIKKANNKQNILNISIPYLNKNQMVTISIITTGSEKEPISNIIGHGKGIEVKEYKNDYKFFLLSLFSTIILLFFIQIMFDSYFIEDRLTSYLPKYIIDLVGGQITEVNVPLISFPLHVKIIGLGTVFFLLIYSIIQMLKKDKF